MRKLLPCLLLVATPALAEPPPRSPVLPVCVAAATQQAAQHRRVQLADAPPPMRRAMLQCIAGTGPRKNPLRWT